MPGYVPAPNSEAAIADRWTDTPSTAQPWSSRAPRTFGKGGVLGLSDALPFNQLFLQIPRRPFWVPKIHPIISLFS